MKKKKLSPAFIKKWKLDNEEVELLEALEQKDVALVPFSKEKEEKWKQAAKLQMKKVSQHKEMHKAFIALSSKKYPRKKIEATENDKIIYDL